MIRLLRPQILSEGFSETPDYAAAHAEYLVHCTNIATIISTADEPAVCDARITRYFDTVGINPGEIA